MLDLQVWKESGEGPDSHVTIRHTFYEKPVTSPLVFHAQGAHAWRAKLVTLSEEVGRRMKNMDSKHTVQERVDVLGVFLQKLCDSNYDQNTREEIIKSGLRKFYREWNRREMESKSLYRSKGEMLEARTTKQLFNKVWFKRKRGGRDIRAEKESGRVQKPGPRGPRKKKEPVPESGENLTGSEVPDRL